MLFHINSIFGSKPGVSKIWYAGQMRPASKFSLAYSSPTSALSPTCQYSVESADKASPHLLCSTADLAVRIWAVLTTNKLPGCYRVIFTFSATIIIGLPSLENQIR